MYVLLLLGILLYMLFVVNFSTAIDFIVVPAVVDVIKLLGVTIVGVIIVIVGVIVKKYQEYLGTSQIQLGCQLGDVL